MHHDFFVSLLFLRFESRFHIPAAVERHHLCQLRCIHTLKGHHTEIVCVAFNVQARFQMVWIVVPSGGMSPNI